MTVSIKLTRACVMGCAGTAVLATVLNALAVDLQDSNPYSVISDRNIFHLNPPPPAVPAEAAKPVELPKVALTAIIGKGSSERVGLAVLPSKDGKESITYLTLGPGERDHDVQVVKIDSHKVEVEIINAGTAQTLNRSNTLASLSSGPHPGGPREERAERGVSGEHGIRRSALPGFNPPAPIVPTASAHGSGSSPLVVGGRDSESSMGGSSGGAIVSGGGSTGGGALIGGGSSYNSQAYVGGGSGAYNNGASAANTTGAQIANSLFNPSTGAANNRLVSSLPAVPPEMQGPRMAAQKLTAPTFPPLPPDVQEELNAATGGGPPPPPMPPGSE